MRPKKTALAESMPPRVRIRREAKGISGADLSRRIGVSPAYVSQIEKGIRVPDIPVAVRIAHVLEDDEALYVAWCRDHKARSRSKTPSTGDEDAWTQLYRSDRFEDDAQFSRAVRSGEDIPPSPRGRAVEVRSMRESSLPAMSAPLFDSTEEPQGSVEHSSPRFPRAPEAKGARSSRRRCSSRGRTLASGTRFRGNSGSTRWSSIRGSCPMRGSVARSCSGPTRRCHGGSATAWRRATSSSCRATWTTGRRCRGGCTRCGRAGRIFLGRLTSYGEKFLVQPGPGESEMVDLGLGVGKPAKPALAGEVVAVVKAG